jgi:hypothetical protein
MSHGHSSRSAAFSPPRAVQPTRGSGVMNGPQGRGTYVNGTRVGPAPPRPGEFGWSQPKSRSSSPARAGTAGTGAEGGGAAAVVLGIILVILLAAAGHGRVHSSHDPALPATSSAGAAAPGPVTVAQVSSWEAWAPAARQAHALRREGLRAFVLASGSYRPFLPGFYVVCVGPFPGTAAGRHSLDQVLGSLPGSQAQRITPRASPTKPQARH